MDENSEDDSYLVFNTKQHRIVIGVLGMLLPFLLFFGGVTIFRMGLQGSLSGYYHTGMRDWFVGTLWVIGFFLFSYKGYQGKDDPDNYLSTIACCPLGPSNSCRRKRKPFLASTDRCFSWKVLPYSLLGFRGLSRGKPF